MSSNAARNHLSSA